MRVRAARRQFPRRLLPATGVPRANQHRRAPRAKLPRDLSADTLVRACNERHFSVESAVRHGSLFS
jgi:hypothetical protein